MASVSYNGKDYEVDSFGFLTNPSAWDENFAIGSALELNIPGGLSDEHWKIINYIRAEYQKTSTCPVVYEACKNINLTLHELRELFPTGYQRGACRISGISFKDGFLRYKTIDNQQEPEAVADIDKTYTIDRYGFLVNPEEWDNNFVFMKSIELKMPPVGEQHWQIMEYLRQKYNDTEAIPPVYETCEDNGIDIGTFNNLFPDGYHRGAVKLAGLRLF